MQKQMILATLGATAMVSAPVLGENFDLSFKGGTVKEYYNALQETAPGIRLVVHPDVDLFMMPAVELPDMTEWGAVQVAAELIDGIEAEFISSEVGETPWDGATFVVTASRGAVADELSVLNTFDLDFSGGSLGTFVEKIRETSDANVFLEPEAVGVAVPPMSLRGADVHNVFVTLEGQLKVPGDLGGRLDVHWTKAGETDNYLYMIGVDEENEWVDRKRQVRYWSLAGMIEGSVLRAEDVLGAIEASQALFHDELTVSYHQPTRILIVRGAQSDLASIEQLLDRIGESSLHMEQGS